MPKKVILHGDALKLLYTFLNYAEDMTASQYLAHYTNYDLEAFRTRAKALQQQLNEGKELDWEELDEALEEQHKEVYGL